MLTSPERAPVPAPNPAPLSSRLAPMQHASRASSAPPRALHDNVAPPHRPVVVAASGPFRGVLKLTDVVAMPLVRTPTPEELQKPYLPVALLGLANNRDRTGYVKLEQRGETVPLPVYHGHPVLTSQEKTFVLRAFSWAEGTFTFQPAPEVSPSSTRTREPMLALVLAGLRPLLRTFGVGELTLALGELIGRAPLVPKDRMARVDRLALSSPELRVLERDFVGKVALREMLSANPVFRGTLATLSFTLQVFGCLEWCEPEVTLGISPEKELERRRLAMLRGNHFDVLGVHWSASPAALKDAREKLGKEYGPGSKWAKLNPGVCRELLQKVEAAYALLKDEDKRVAYRRTAYPDVDPELLDGLLESQMKALEWRGATEEAQDTRQIRHELRASVAGRPPTQRS
jgi:hypothetical protein